VTANPTDRLGFLVRAVSHTMTQRLEQVLRPIGLTQAQLAALAQLAVGPAEGLSGAELGRRAVVTAQAMSAAVASLAQRGLVTRAPSPSHGRVIEVRITPAGRELLERAKDLTAPVHAQATAQLSDVEAEQLRSLLKRTMSALGLHLPLDAGGHADRD